MITCLMLIVYDTWQYNVADSCKLYNVYNLQPYSICKIRNNVTMVTVIAGGLSHWVQRGVTNHKNTQFILVEKGGVRYKVMKSTGKFEIRAFTIGCQLIMGYNRFCLKWTRSYDMLCHEKGLMNQWDDRNKRLKIITIPSISH